MKRLVIIGYGNIAKKHVEVFRTLNCEIVASCNRSEIGNKLARTDGGITRTYTDYHLMIKEESPDGIIVCVSFDQVYNVVKSVLVYGLPLLIEKPTGTSLEQHLELAELADQNKTPTQVGLNRRHYSVMRKALADCGGVESITSINFEWSENILQLKKKLTDDQILLSNFRNTIHGLDLIYFLSGGMRNTSINTRYFGEPHKYITQLSAIGNANNALINFYNTWESPIPWRLFWTSGGLRYKFMPLETCYVFDDFTKEKREILPDIHDHQFKHGFFEQAIKFIDLMNGKPGDLSLLNVTETMRLCESCTQNLMESKIKINSEKS